MKPFLHLLSVVALLLVPAGCDVLTEGSHAGGPGSSPLLREEREWRIVFLFLDENDLEEVADKAVQAIAAYPDPLGFTHRIVLRARTYDGSFLETAAHGTLQRIPLEGLPGGSLLDGSTIGSVLKAIHREFPSPRQVLFLIGHGRGWRGLGYSKSDATRYLSAPALREIAHAAPADYNLLVLDAGWSAFAEVLVELSDAPVDVIASETNLVRRGIDYGELLRLLDTSSWSPGAMRDAAGRALRDAGYGEAPVQLLREELPLLRAHLSGLITATAPHVEREPNRDELRGVLMSRAVPATTPGDAHITLRALREALPADGYTGEPSAFDSLLLHLVTVDELGLPAGHATSYRAAGESADTPSFFRELSWAPDFFGRHGVLFDLWYREY